MKTTHKLEPTADAIDAFLTGKRPGSDRLVNIRTANSRWRCVCGPTDIKTVGGERYYETIRGEGSSNGGRVTLVKATTIVEAVGYAYEEPAGSLGPWTLTKADHPRLAGHVGFRIVDAEGVTVAEAFTANYPVHVCPDFLRVMAGARDMLAELQGVLRCFERDDVAERQDGTGVLVRINRNAALRIRELIGRLTTADETTQAETPVAG